MICVSPCLPPVSKTRGLARGLLLLFATLLQLLSACLAAPRRLPQDTAASIVTLETPREGVSTDRIIHVSGSVSDPNVRQITVVYNGASYTARVRGGHFERNLVASPGPGVIEVYARGPRGTGKATVSLLSRVPRNQVQVVMGWDADSCDLDLSVTDPRGEVCDYTHRETAAGGSLDVDVTDGYGPEMFTSTHAVPGTYQVNVKFYGDSRGHTTPVRVYARVVLFEGTDREYRKEYSVWISKPDEVINLTTFNVFAH